MELLNNLQQSYKNFEFRLSRKDPTKVLKKYGKKWYCVCKHGRIKRICKECSGSGICEHGRRKQRCKNCGGSSFCKHGLQKYRCKECGGTGLCKHGRRKHICIDCGGFGICEHSRRRSTCKDCVGSNICEHSKMRNTCKECKGSSICDHGKVRSKCIHCKGSSICSCGKHFKVKNSLCSACLKCGNSGCVGIPSNVFGYDYCYPCGCFKFGKTPREKRQDTVFEFIAENFPESEIRYDKQLPDQNCTKFRPDVLFVLPFRKLIVECDENSHKLIPNDCEAKRMSDLASSGEILPTVFIRFNPDLYRDSEGKKRKISIEQRLSKLRDEIEYWLDQVHEQKEFITVVYLYYDNSKIREIDSIAVWKA